MSIIARLTIPKLLVFREKEQKRYDFEAATATDAAEIVEEIRRGMEPYSQSQQSTM